MFTEEEMQAGLGGLTVKDAHIAMQILEKAAMRGIISPAEFGVLSEWRKSFSDAIKRSIGDDYDQRAVAFQQAQMDAAKAAEAAKAQETTEVPAVEGEIANG